MADDAPWLLVGLGNPGAKYAHNRHNVGVMVVRAWVEARVTAPTWQSRWDALVHSLSTPFGRVVAACPQTFMNCSGSSVSRARGFLQVPFERVVVVHDEIDFDFARLAIKRGGGHGGHNGLRDLVAALGTGDFVRVRVGVGRPERGDVTPWVLGNFDPVSAAELPELVERAGAAITAIFTEGVAAAMNRYNRAPS